MPEIPITTDPLIIPIPGLGIPPVQDVPVQAPGPQPEKERLNMAMDATIAGSLEAVVLSQAQGHAFAMEQGRLGMLEGKVGMREGLTQRIN